MKMIIMSGISGAGKSTKARELRDLHKQQQLNAEIYSTDDFYVIDGKYQFDINLAPENHRKNQDRVYQACRNAVDVVIVDNTNLTLERVKPYILIAEIFGYHIEFCRVEATIELSRRNVHDVPEHIRQEMIEIMEDISIFINYANKIHTN